MKFFKNILRFFNTDHYISYYQHWKIMEEQDESHKKNIENILDFLFNEKRITKEQYSEMKELWCDDKDEFIFSAPFPYVYFESDTKSKYPNVKWDKKHVNLFQIKYLLSKGYITINTKEINKLKK